MCFFIPNWFQNQPYVLQTACYQLSQQWVNKLYLCPVIKLGTNLHLDT